jgi:hypothetical protein
VWQARTSSGHVEPSTVKKQHANTFKVLSDEAEKKSETPIRPFVLYSLRVGACVCVGTPGMPSNDVDFMWRRVGWWRDEPRSRNLHRYRRREFHFRSHSLSHATQLTLVVH